MVPVLGIACIASTNRRSSDMQRSYPHWELESHALAISLAYCGRGGARKVRPQGEPQRVRESSDWCGTPGQSVGRMLGTVQCAQYWCTGEHWYPGHLLGPGRWRRPRHLSAICAHARPFLFSHSGSTETPPPHWWVSAPFPQGKGGWAASLPAPGHGASSVGVSAAAFSNFELSYGT